MGINKTEYIREADIEFDPHKWWDYTTAGRFVPQQWDQW